MKFLLALTLGFFYVLPAIPAIAEVYVNNNSPKKVSITGLQPHSKYRLISSSFDRIKKKANECGQVTMGWDTNFTINGSTYDINNLTVKDPARCVSGQLSYPQNEVIYNGEQKIVIPGLVPYQDYTITSGVFRETKTSKSNACGFVTFTETPEMQLSGFMNLWDEAYTTPVINVLRNANQGQIPLCKNAILYTPQ